MKTDRSARALATGVRNRRSRFPLGPRLAAMFSGVPLLAGLFAPSAVGQCPMPPLDVKVSVDGNAYLGTLSSPSDYYLKIQCSASSIAAGGWYGAVADAVVTDPEYFTAGGGLPGLAASTVSLATVAAHFHPNEAWLYTGAEWDLSAREEDCEALMSRMILTDGAPDPDAVRKAADPLYQPVNSNGIVQDFGLTKTPEWPGDNGAFNLDAIAQAAVWNRVGPDLGMSMKEFFDDPDQWGAILKYGLEVSITLIGARGATVLPEHGVIQGSLQQPPGLEGLPYQPPKLTVSRPGRITFVGTGLGHLAFFPLWTNPMVPVQTVAPGATLELPAAGYRPRMQIALCAEGPSGQPRFDLCAAWSDFGEIEVMIPANAQAGYYQVRHYRYCVPDSNGTQFMPWQTVPGGQRPRVLVLGR